MVQVKAQHAYTSLILASNLMSHFIPSFSSNRWEGEQDANPYLQDF